MKVDRQVLKCAVAPWLAVFCSIALAEPVRAETLALALVCNLGGAQQHISIDLTQQRVLISSADATGGPIQRASLTSTCDGPSLPGMRTRWSSVIQSTE